MDKLLCDDGRGGLTAVGYTPKIRGDTMDEPHKDREARQKAWESKYGQATSVTFHGLGGRTLHYDQPAPGPPIPDPNPQSDRDSC